MGAREGHRSCRFKSIPKAGKVWERERRAGEQVVGKGGSLSRLSPGDTPHIGHVTTEINCEFDRLLLYSLSNTCEQLSSHAAHSAYQRHLSNSSLPSSTTGKALAVRRAALSAPYPRRTSNPSLNFDLEVVENAPPTRTKYAQSWNTFRVLLRRVNRIGCAARYRPASTESLRVRGPKPPASLRSMQDNITPPPSLGKTTKYVPS